MYNEVSALFKILIYYHIIWNIKLNSYQNNGQKKNTLVASLY